MKHIEPQQAAPRPQPARARKSSHLGWVALLLAVTLGLGAAGNAMFGSPSPDRLSPGQTTQLRQDFDQRPARRLRLQAVPEAEQAKAMDSMQLSPTERAMLEAQLKPTAAPGGQAQPGAQPLHLAWVTVWDHVAQDGDVVAIISGGFRREVVITHAQQTIAIPVDTEGSVHVLGVHDGGGGITVGLAGPSGQVLLPVMSVGEPLTLPVVF